MSEFDGSRNDAEHVLSLLPPSQSINYLNGVTTIPPNGSNGEYLITNPGNATKLVIQLETGQWRMVAGDYLARQHVSNDELGAIFNTITYGVGVDPRFTSGDGPFQLVLHEAYLPTGQDVTINAGNFTLDSHEDSNAWRDIYGFGIDSEFDVTGSASNNSSFTQDGGSAGSLVLSTVDVLTPEATQDDLVIVGTNAALPSELAAVPNNLWYVRVIDTDPVVVIDLHLTKAAAQDPTSTEFNFSGDDDKIGGIRLLGGLRFSNRFTSPSSGQTTDGFGSVLLDAAKSTRLVFAAPDNMTFAAVDDTSALAYWWVP